LLEHELLCSQLAARAAYWAFGSPSSPRTPPQSAKNGRNSFEQAVLPQLAGRSHSSMPPGQQLSITAATRSWKSSLLPSKQPAGVLQRAAADALAGGGRLCRESPWEA
jgi:hypothetical protein